MAYSPVLNGQIAPGQPGTSNLFYQLRDNPISMFAGDTGAPRLQLAALPRLEEGNVVVCEDLNEYTTPASTQEDLHVFAFIQKGMVRIKVRQKSITAGDTTTINIIRKRRGNTVTAASFTTTSGTYVNQSVDVAVQVGDEWRLFSSTPGGSGMQTENFQLCTTGDLIYPGAYMPVVAW